MPPTPGHDQGKLCLNWTIGWLLSAHFSDPDRLVDAFFLRLFDLDRRLPGWLRSPYRGAVFIFGLALGWLGKLFVLLILGTLMALAGPFHGVRVFLLMLGVAIVAGTAAGIVSGLFEPLGRAGRLGEWFRWSLAIFAYLTTVSLLVPSTPFALPDPAFYWLAGSVAALGAIGLVLTDDRGRSRLPPHQFLLVRNLAALRAAPGRSWLLAKERLTPQLVRQQELEAELASRPEVREELRHLLLIMRTDLGHVRPGLERFVRLLGADPDTLAEADAWLSRIDRRLAELDGGPGTPERSPLQRQE